jgi:hypothetical protein
MTVSKASFLSSHIVLLTLALAITSCRQGGELANESLSGGKLEDESISGEKLADGSVTPEKLDRTYQQLLSPGTTAHYFRGDQTWQTLNTSVIPEVTNLYYTDARSRAAISASAPLSYSSATGVLSLGTVPLANGGTGLTSLGTANQLLGVNSGATGAEYKSLLGTTDQIIATHAAGSITFSTPQNIASTSSPTFAGLTLTGLTGFVRASTGTISASALSSSDVTTALAYTPVNLAGDTMTGTLSLPSDGLLVGTNDLVFSTGNVGLGTTSPDHKLDVEVEDLTNNAVTVAARVTHSTTGIPAAGMGTGLDLAAETSDELTISTLARIEAKLTNATTASEDADLEFKTVASGALNTVMSLSSSGNVGIGTSAAPNSVLQVDGPISTAISTQTALTYTITATDSVIIVDATSNNVDISLPSASGIAGRKYTIKRIDSSANTVNVIGSIDGVLSYALTQWQYVAVVSDGTQWYIIANN